MSEPWRPVLDGDLADRTLEAVFAIAEDILRVPGRTSLEAGDWQERVSGATLASGAAGQALLYSYLALHTGEDRWADLAMDFLDRAGEVASSTRMGESLYSGFPGIAWVGDHLRGRVYEGDPDENREVDETLLSALEHPPWPPDYDLINGLVGLGVYALEGLHRPTAAACLERIVARLGERARQEPEGAAWFSPAETLPGYQREQHPDGLYNLGMSHGAAGIVALLGAACDAGTAGARPLLDRAMAWLLARRQPANQGFAFSNFHVPGTEPSSSRLAWCYGDPGMGAALLVAARGAGEPAWERTALEVTRAAASRPEELSRIQDSSLCHGTSGLAHLFHRLYIASGDETLANAARFWYERTLGFRIPGLGFGGFRPWSIGADGIFDWREDPGFLQGSAGVGLALLSAVSTVEPAWDRVLLLSLREPGLSPSLAATAL